MATRTFTFEEVEVEEDIRYTPYSFHILTPTSRNIVRGTPAHFSDNAEDTTPLHFPERGHHVGQAPCPTHSLSPVRVQTEVQRIAASQEPERSFRHQYYTPESAEIPVRAAPGQSTLANELELADEIPPVQRSPAAPTRGQELLADLVATERHVSPPNQQSVSNSRPRYRTPPTPEVFHEYLDSMEHPTKDIMDVSIDEPPDRRAHRPLLGHPMAESTPAAHGTNSRRSPTFQTYSEGYREVMSESPPIHHTSPRVTPNTPIRRLAACQQIDNSVSQNALLNLVGPARNLLNALGFHTEGRTNIGILRLLQQIVRLTDDEVTPELMRNLQHGNNVRDLVELEERTHQSGLEDLIDNPEISSFYSSHSSAHTHASNSASPRQHETYHWEDEVVEDYASLPIHGEPRSRIRQGTPWNPRYQYPQRRTNSDESEIPRPSNIPRCQVYGSSGWYSQSNEDDDFFTSIEMEEDWDPVPPYPGRSPADVEKQLVAMRQYERRTSTVMSHTSSGPWSRATSISHGTRGCQPPVTMETIPEGPTIESMNSEVRSTPTSSSNNRNPSRRRRKAIEWHPAEELEERDDNSPNSDKGKPEEPVPDNITTNIETPEDPKPQFSPKKSPLVSFVRDTPPHQAPRVANYDTGYTNPYQRDNRPGIGTSSYPHIPNKGKQRAEPEVSFDDRIPCHSRTGDLEDIDLEIQQGIIDSFIEKERHKDMGTQPSAFKSHTGSFEKFFTPDTSFHQPPTSPIFVSLAGFESNSATGNPQKATDIPVIMTSGGGGGGNDPPDSGNNPGYDSDEGPDDKGPDDEQRRQPASHGNSPRPSNSGGSDYNDNRCNQGGPCYCSQNRFGQDGQDGRDGRDGRDGFGACHCDQRSSADDRQDWEFKRRLKEIERDELNRESKLDINKPSPFTGEDRNEWREFKENCENFFAAKPRIYSNDISKISFAAFYMKGPAKRYYQNLMRRQRLGHVVPPLIQ
ncbi:hypothetical protein FB446DRAFT_793155 [Lentinula raphanica]|nr:hypothetical protein FB446DRAFT_793155 [Lentinula raphanica]